LPRSVRPAFGALWNLDLAFADIIATSSEPALGAIRMAWWRERLEELDAGARAPAEPRLGAVAAELLPRGVSGADLSRLEDAWLPLLNPFPWVEEAAEGLRQRGRILFGIGAYLLKGNRRDAEAAGALWSLVDAARHCSDLPSRTYLLKEARNAIADLPRERPPMALRALTVLAALAAHEVLRNKPLDMGGGMGRLSVAVTHRIRGTLPRG
jgi:phytoene synthase